jgi:hypothetical protein
MADILEHVHEILDKAAGRILELMGYRYKLREARVPVRGARRVTGARRAQRSPFSGPTCNRY